MNISDTYRHKYMCTHTHTHTYKHTHRQDCRKRLFFTLCTGRSLEYHEVVQENIAIVQPGFPQAVGRGYASIACDITPVTTYITRVIRIGFEYCACLLQHGQWCLSIHSEVPNRVRYADSFLACPKPYILGFPFRRFRVEGKQLSSSYS